MPEKTAPFHPHSIPTKRTLLFVQRRTIILHLVAISLEIVPDRLCGSTATTSRKFSPLCARPSKVVGLFLIDANMAHSNITALIGMFGRIPTLTMRNRQLRLWHSCTNSSSFCSCLFRYCLITYSSTTVVLTLATLQFYPYRTPNRIQRLVHSRCNFSPCCADAVGFSHFSGRRPTPVCKTF